MAIIYYTRKAGGFIITCLSSDTKPAATANGTLIETDTAIVYKNNGGTWAANAAGSGDLVSTNNLSDVANASTARTNLGLATTANQTDSVDKRFMTDAQESKLDAISGTNTGDNATNTQYSGLAASKQDALVSATNIKTVTGITLLGSGNLYPEITYASAFATATTSISAATYADITGASVSLVAGTWIIFAHVVGAAANAITQGFVAITHSDNTVIAESAFTRPASGTASLNSPMAVTWQAIVTPGSTTTYKLRAARGLTTHTATWTVYDGTGYNTANHATNNTDKGTSIIAIRIA